MNNVTPETLLTLEERKIVLSDCDISLGSLMHPSKEELHKATLCAMKKFKKAIHSLSKR